MRKYIKIAVITLLITVTTAQAQTQLISEGQTLPGGFQPELRGKYSNNLDNFKRDLVIAVNANAAMDLFQDPNFVNRLVVNAQNETGDKSVKIQNIIDEGVMGDAPAGFIQSTNATHEMSVWTADATQIALWGARDPYVNKGEKFLWFRGKCIMSLYCANLVRQVHKKIPEEKLSEYAITTQEKLTYSGGGNTFNFTFSNIGGNATATGGTSTATNTGGGLGESNLRISRRPDIIDDGYDDRRQVRQSYQQIEVKRDGWAKFKDAAIGVTGLAFGVAAIKTAFAPPIQRYEVATYNRNDNYNYSVCNMGHRNCGTLHQQPPRVSYGPGFQGIYNDHPQIRDSNDPNGAPVQGGFGPVSNYYSNTSGGGTYYGGTDYGDNNGGFQWGR